MKKPLFILLPSVLLLAIQILQLIDKYEVRYSHWDGIRALLFATLILAVFAVLIQRLTKDYVKTGVFCLVLTIFFFFYSIPAHIGQALGIIFWFIIMVFAEKGVFKERILTSFALIFGAMFLGLAAYHGSFHVDSSPPKVQANALSQSVELTQKPNIIHIVLDAYGSQDTLKKYYDYDNRPFSDGLKNRGFHVFDNVISPHNHTAPALATIFNGAYLEPREDQVNPRRYRLSLRRQIAKSKLKESLEQNGYRINQSQSEFKDGMIAGSKRVPFFIPRLTSLEHRLLFPLSSQQKARAHYETLQAVLSSNDWQDWPEPFFYFEHLMSPHPPFVFDKDGEFQVPERGDFTDGYNLHHGTTEGINAYKQGYRNNLNYIEDAILKQIENLPSGPLIVILHGDHGPRGFVSSNRVYCPQETQTTFLAIYSNIDAVNTQLDILPTDKLNLVNIYRIIVSGISDENYAVLENQSVYSLWADPNVRETLTASDLERVCLYPEDGH